MQQETNKDVDLLAINRYKNLMRLVDTEYNNKIQALCRALEMPHLSNFLSHKSIPKKKIGPRMARNIEFKLSLAVRSLDASPDHLSVPSSEYIDDCPVKRARYDNLMMLANLISPGNVSRFGDFLGCHVSNYLGAKRSRSIGDKLARKIESVLQLGEYTLDTRQSHRFLVSVLNEQQLIECIEQYQATYNEQLFNLERLNEKQEQTISTMLQRLASELAESTDYELLANDDSRKIFLPYSDKQACLPVLLRPHNGDNWEFWVIGTLGMKTHFDKITRHAIEGTQAQKAWSSFTIQDSKISIVDPVNHNHQNLPGINRSASLVIKRATYDLQDTVDEVLSLRMTMKETYNALVDTQIHYLTEYSHWSIQAIKEHFSSGLNVPIATINAHGQKLKTVLLPTMKTDIQTKDIKEFVRKMAKQDATLTVLPIQFENQHQLGNKLLNAKLWLKHL